MIRFLAKCAEFILSLSSLCTVYNEIVNSVIKIPFKNLQLFSSLVNTFFTGIPQKKNPNKLRETEVYRLQLTLPQNICTFQVHRVLCSRAFSSSSVLLPANGISSYLPPFASTRHTTIYVSMQTVWGQLWADTEKVKGDGQRGRGMERGR